jgi:hypothetical protein
VQLKKSDGKRGGQAHLVKFPHQFFKKWLPQVGFDLFYYSAGNITFMLMSLYLPSSPLATRIVF